MVRNGFQVLNKKGSLTDGIFVYILFFMLVIGSIVFVLFINNLFNDSSFIAVTGTSTQGNATLQVGRNFASSTIDNMVVAFYFLAHIIMIVLAAFLPISPIFIMVNLVFSFSIIFISYAFSSGLAETITTSGVTGLGKTLWIVNHGTILELIWIALVIIAMFMAGNRNSGGGV
jgi:hypothetical protein